MPHRYEQRLIVPYAASVLVDIVLDVEEYPLFLPWCKSSKILSGNRDNMEVELEVAWNSICSKYTSKVEYIVEDSLHIIDIKSVNGPFKLLNSRWSFRKLSNSETEAFFTMQLEMKSYLVNKLVGTVFNQLAQETSLAFTERLHSTI